MDYTSIIVAVLALVGIVVANHFQQKRWQDTQRTERRDELATALEGLAQQSRGLFEDAVKLGDVHRADAEAARNLALATKASSDAAILEMTRGHSECRQEVARLSGQLDELRLRQSESERTSGITLADAEKHKYLKHEAFQALTISEGYLELVRRLLPSCDCGAFEPINHLTEMIKPRLSGLLNENKLPPDEWSKAKLSEMAKGIARLEEVAAQPSPDEQPPDQPADQTPG